MFDLCRNQVVVFFTSKMFEEHLWKSDILSKDASQRHFANKNQLPGFYIGGTLVENGLILRRKYL